MKNLLSAILFALMISLVACGKGDNNGTSDGGKPIVDDDKNKPTDRGTSEERNPEFENKWNDFYKSKFDTGDTVVIGTIGDADSLLDPIHQSRGASEIIALMFVMLTRTNPDFSHSPMLAERWEFSKDHLELTFFLRKDFEWHDGKPVTAHDVVFTYEKQIDPKVAYSAASWKEKIEKVEAVDDHIVKFTYKELYPYQLMDATVGYILPKHLLEEIPTSDWKTCDFNRNPVGCGPYKFKEWKAQQFITVVANEDWPDGRPPLDKIIFKVVPDQENLILQLKSGQIDVMNGVPPRFVEDLSKEKHLKRHVFPSRAYTYLGWNLKRDLFKSAKIRQALTMAIDREKIVKSVLKGVGQVCHGPISPIIWAYNPEVPKFPFDLDRARKLLKEEGWEDTDGDGWLDKDGKIFEFEIKTNKGNKDREDISIIVQSMLKKVGVKVTPNILEWTILIGDLDKRNFDATIMGWSVGLKMDMTSIWHSKSAKEGKFNFVSYINKEFDELNDKAAVEMDRKKAQQMWFTAQNQIAEAQPYTFLYIPKSITFVSNRLQNVQAETVGWSYNLEQWWVPKDKQKFK